MKGEVDCCTQDPANHTHIVGAFPVPVEVAVERVAAVVHEEDGNGLSEKPVGDSAQ